MMKMKLVVVGNGMVGHKLLEELVDRPQIEVTVLCEEPRPAYDRVHLSEFFSGKTAQDLSLVAPGFFEPVSRGSGRPMRRAMTTALDTEPSR